MILCTVKHKPNTHGGWSWIVLNEIYTDALRMAYRDLREILDQIAWWIKLSFEYINAPIAFHWMLGICFIFVHFCFTDSCSKVGLVYSNFQYDKHSDGNELKLWVCTLIGCTMVMCISADLVWMEKAIVMIIWLLWFAALSFCLLKGGELQSCIPKKSLNFRRILLRLLFNIGVRVIWLQLS